MNPTSPAQISRQSKLPPIRGNPGVVSNRILLGLPRRECSELFSKLEFASLPVCTVLNEAGETIREGFFMNEGLASVLAVDREGRSVEVGLTGKEGFVGIPLIAGLKASATRTIVQISGNGFRLTAKDLTSALRHCPKLEDALQRYGQELHLQASQVAACNGLHKIHQRLARWLLMSQDRLGSEVIPLTQEFLSHMLGKRRASVTVSAGVLQKARLISYNRGVVVIKNRKGLEKAACDCYRIMSEQLASWRGNSN